ncbi:MAG: DUF4157 domain-containing protein, partial [Puniceicoccaceae bacterium]
MTTHCQAPPTRLAHSRSAPVLPVVHRISLMRNLVAASGPALAPPIVHDVVRSSGQPLPAAVRGRMEARFGYDFSTVRIHSGERAAASARAVAARAYT